MQKIREQFIRVQERHVLVRYAGHGPALILLHQSPQNSRAMLPWIERLAERYSVFAPDTPGFGYSDPLPLAQPTIPDYAAALDALCEKLAINRALLYGVHTGAVTALRFALDFPDRVAALVCDGYARFDAAERQALLGEYLPPFEPKWDGTHLLWLFARFREQNLFFPWNIPTAAARLAYPPPTTVKLHSDVMDVLDAGDGYRVGYRAPFLYDDPNAAARLAVPSAIFYRAEDVLAPHLSRLPLLPAHVSATKIDGGATALIEKCDQFFSQHAPAATTMNSELSIASAASSVRFISPLEHGPLAYRTIAGNINCAEICLNDFGAPAVIPVDGMQGAFVLIPDLPNHGASRGWRADAVTARATADAILSVAGQLKLTNITVRATGGACAIAVLLAQQLGARCTKLILHNVLPLNEAERSQFLQSLPGLTPVATGAHLIAAWNWARSQHLFWPWLPADAFAARKRDAPSPYRVHAEVVEMLRAGDSFVLMWRAALEIDLAAEISKLDCAIHLVSTDESERVRLAERLVDKLKLSAIEDVATGAKQWQFRN
jgi:pimeloyl-ACP methyl ester carboxylesterase